MPSISTKISNLIDIKKSCFKIRKFLHIKLTIIAAIIIKNKLAYCPFYLAYTISGTSLLKFFEES